MKTLGRVQRLSLKRYNRLIKGYPDEGLMQFSGKRIRYALIVLEMINRKPVEILMAEYSFFSFDSKGRLDASEREKATRLVMDTLEPIVPEEKPGKVIDVKHRFAKKDLMINIYGNQRLRLKQLFRGQFSADLMKAIILD